MAESEHRTARALAIVVAGWILGYWLWAPGVHRSLPQGSLADPTSTELQEPAPPSSRPAASRTPLQEAPAVRAQRPSDDAGSTAVPSAEPVREPLAIHTVRPNDTLGGISLRYYGTVRHADLIYRANRDQLDDPDSLALGQLLVIPAIETDPG